ncbi:MAG: hypothetical protein K8U57_08610 [Planctomycetes bacterium]|nr:hypothetical protein [Planctomycetota bacterium]
MAKKKSESTTAENTTPTDAPKAEKPTQAEAVKQAIAAGKGLPSDGVKFIKETFGMELTNSTFSTVKTKLNKGSGTSSGKRGRPPGPAKAAAPTSKPASASVAVPTNGKPHGTSGPAELAWAVKQLVKQYGVETVKSMADVFAS